jgi:hypothetical protein
MMHVIHIQQSFEGVNQAMKTKTNLIVDVAIFAAFLIVSNPHLTGNTIHEWLGVSFAAAIITHLLLHWDWIVKVGREFFKKLIHQSRLNFVVNTLFFIAITGSMFSGLLISKDVMLTCQPRLEIHPHADVGCVAHRAGSSRRFALEVDREQHRSLHREPGAWTVPATCYFPGVDRSAYES